MGFLFSLLGPLPRAALPNMGAPGPTVPQLWKIRQCAIRKRCRSHGRQRQGHLLGGGDGRAGPRVFKTGEFFSKVSLSRIFFLLGWTKGISSCWSNR